MSCNTGLASYLNLERIRRIRIPKIAFSVNRTEQLVTSLVYCLCDEVHGLYLFLKKEMEHILVAKFVRLIRR